jgi:hypothetical protein
VSGVFPNSEAKVGHSVGHEDDTLLTYRQSFTGFLTMWKSDLSKETISFWMRYCREEFELLRNGWKKNQDMPARLSWFCRIIVTTRKSRDVGAGSG